VPILVKIDQEMRPRECSQTHRHTDVNRFYNLFRAICYSYGTDNKGSSDQHCLYLSHLVQQYGCFSSPVDQGIQLSNGREPLVGAAVNGGRYGL